MKSLYICFIQQLMVIVLVLSCLPAYSQDKNTKLLLEEVVVTAQKRSQNLNDVPITISAFTGEALGSLGISSSGDLGDFISGLEIGTSSGEGSQLIVFLRGAGLSDFNSNNAGPVGIYADEVYISSPILTTFQFFDTQRVEVLKGPQGTLYGRNTTGGAIKFISNSPTEEFEGQVRASVGNFGRTQIEAAISGPITDSVRARVAVNKVDSDGWLKNTLDGSYENGLDTTSWRTMLDIDANDKVSFRVNLHGADNSSPSYKIGHVGVIPPNGEDALGYRDQDGFFEGQYNRGGEFDLSAIGGYVQADIQLGDLTLTSVTAYDDVDSLVDEETDASPVDLLTIEYGVESETVSQELRLSGSTDNVEWLVGGFYLDEDLNQDQTIDLFRELRAFTGGLSDPFGEVTGAPVLFVRVLNNQSTKTAALFGQAEVQLNDKWGLTFGGRYTNEKREFNALGQLEDAAIFGPDGLPLYQFNGLELSDDAFSWRLGASFRPNDSSLMFASISRGFKSGGFNGGFLSLDANEAAVQAQPYDPEFVTAYELGIKSTLLDGKMQLNSSVFYNDFEDLQVFTLINTDALPIQVLDNSSSGESYGLEFDMVYYPVDSWLISLNGAFMSSELKDFIATGGNDFSGNEIARTPSTSLSGIVRHDHQFEKLATVAYGQISVAYKSDQFFTTENSPLLAQDSYSLVSARVGYRSNNDAWEVALFGNNLTDEEYLTNGTDLSDFGLLNVFQGVPRTYGVEVLVNF